MTLRLGGLLLVLLCPGALAQGSGHTVAWERMPLLANGALENAYDVAFLPDPDGTLGERALLWISADGPFRYDPRPGHETWTQICTSGCGPDVGIVTTEGSVLIAARGGVTNTDRLPPGGRWEYKVNNAGGGSAAIFQSSLPALQNARGHGPIFTASYPVFRSDDDGRPGSWRKLGEPGGEVVSFGEVPPSAPLPQGRLLAGLYNGVAYSDDGGVTWAPGAGAYGFARFVTHSFTFVPEAGHPYGGAVLAGIDDLEFGRDSTATVYRSDDGGSNWSRVYRFSPSALGLANANKVDLVAAPDGSVVWAGVTFQLGGLSRFQTGTVVRSADGGRTWTQVAEGYGGPGLESITIGPDGRLYAGTVVGIWRTTAPVYAVAGEESPEPLAADVGLRVFPNPTAGRATVTVALAAPGRVTVRVYDAQGREVAAVWDGPATDGQRFAVETAGLAPGAYVVRVAAASGAVASVRLAVAR